MATLRGGTAVWSERPSPATTSRPFHDWRSREVAFAPIPEVTEVRTSAGSRSPYLGKTSLPPAAIHPGPHLSSETILTL